MRQQIVFGDDLPRWAIVLAVLIFVGYFVRASVAFRARVGRRLVDAILDLICGALVMGAVLRPSWLTSESTPIGARVAVLLDNSRRLELKAGDSTRRLAAMQVIERINAHFNDARIAHFEFGRGPLQRRDGSVILDNNGIESAEGTPGSDLTRALERLEGLLGEKPAAVVVVSDGRLSRPTAAAENAALEVPGALHGTVLHTVYVGGSAPADASILSIETSGNAVAHQPFSIDVTVGCFGGLSCARVPVTVRELKKGVAASVLATGEVRFSGQDTARVSFQLTIERAGMRIIEVALSAPPGDEIPENDARMLSFRVLRDRLRLLHVAGRPTYDVRALRNWLKSDTSVDLVSFFILRTDGDDTNTEEDSELALIPFPVDELFDEHLPSFDAVVLGDIDAERYRLARYLGNLAKYVEQGGGLILIGGPSAFGGGAYAASPLDRVMPVSLANSERPFDTVEFIPRLTGAGREAALLAPLRGLVGEALPSMPGANSLGLARSRAVVLWEHASRNVLPVKTGGPPGAMPVLAVSEVGDGRVVALGVDGTHRLAFGSDAVKTGGRAFGALWDGLLGWVIRDPRFESAHGELLGECIAANPARVRVSVDSRSTGRLSIEVEPLEGTRQGPIVRQVVLDGRKSVDIDLGPLAAGAYSALVRVGDEPAVRFDFACEAGGMAWSETRPDPERLIKLARANGGMYVDAENVDRLEAPAQVLVHGSRRVKPILLNWLWALLAAAALATNWLWRRSEGLP